MSASWFRRAALALACAGAAATLGACGSGSVVSDLKPTRFITVGDGFADVGQNGYVFTINYGPTTYNPDGSWDGLSNFNWVQQLAAYYGVQLQPASQGCDDYCWGYAQGHARVASADTTSGTNAPSIAQQIDTLLARPGFAFDSSGDVVVVAGGIDDIVEAVNATGISVTTTQTVQAAGKALGDQVQRLVNSGAKHVLVVGIYWLGNTPWGHDTSQPWANGTDQSGAINTLSTAFNDSVKLELADTKWAKSVLFVDAAQFYNLIYNKPENYPLGQSGYPDATLGYPDPARDPVCATPDATTCTPSTLVTGAGASNPPDPTRWMFADNLYITPTFQRMLVNDGYLENIYYYFRYRW